MPRWVLTGHCADGPAWNDSDTYRERETAAKQIHRCKIQTKPTLLRATPKPTLFFLKSFGSPVSLSHSFMCFFLPTLLGDYWVQWCTAVWSRSRVEVEVGKEGRIL